MYSVVIVSGPRDCGKTSWCREHLRSSTTDGVLLAKVFRDNLLIGYDAACLDSGESVPLMRTRESAPPGWDQVDEIGQYSISARGISTATDWIRYGAEQSSKDIVVDEVGRLELQKRGFFEVVRSALEALASAGKSKRRTLYLVVRNAFVRDIMKCFAIPAAEVIWIEKSLETSRGILRL